jgi:transposase
MTQLPPVSPVPPDATVEQLLVLLTERDRLIEQLVGRLTQLEARLGRNSQNSSRPPSSDAFVKPPPRSLRRASGRKPGKGGGERGFRLEPRPDPDEVQIHRPSACSRCGAGLTAAPVVGERRRQVFDLPAIRLRVIEHRAQRCACRCGALTDAPFPAEASAPTCYGPGVAALGVYLLGRQHLPVDRAAQCLADCFGAPVSTGYLAGLLPAAAARLDGFCARTRAEMSAGEVVNFDETGGRVAAGLWWVHVACTDRRTLYHLDAHRGQTALDAAGVLPHFTGIAVHDGWAAYRRYPQVTHALCNAHHLRELAGMAEVTGQSWPTALADLLVEAHVAVQNAIARGQRQLSPELLADLDTRYDQLLAEGQRLNPPPPRTGKRGHPKLGPVPALLARLDTHRDDVLRFTVDFRVPFDNNQAERDIRMIKLQQKISGGWRTEAGAQAFLAVRSYLSTAAKNGQAAIDVLRGLFTGHIWLPATTGP